MKNYILFSFVWCLTLSLQAQVWQPVISGTTLKLNSVSFGSPLVGYIGANDSTLLKTTDGGKTWNVQPTQGMNFKFQGDHIIQVDFINELVGFAMIGEIQYAGVMYKTVDGGANWTIESVGMCSPLFSFNFDADNSYVVGAHCFGGKTIDKKVNGSWLTNTKYLDWSVNYLRTITFYDSLYGITAGDGGNMHRTFDGGQNWDTITTFTTETIRDLQFVNDSVIYGVVDSLSNTLIFSNDSGSTWTTHSGSLTFYYPQLKEVTSNANEEVIAVGVSSTLELGIILWGKGEGGNWNVEAVDQPLNAIVMINDTLAIAVGDSGEIVMNNGIINSVKNVVEEIDIQLYPNPAKEFITVSSSIDIESIEIIDLSGRRIKRVTGAYEKIPVQDLKSGVYYVTITTIVGQISKLLILN